MADFDKEYHEETINSTVDWLRNAAPYIYLFRNKIFIVSISKRNFPPSTLSNLIQDLSFLCCIGVKIVIVFDPKDLFEKELKTRNQTITEINGHNIIDEITVECMKIASGIMRFNLEALFSTSVTDAPITLSDVKIVSGNFVNAKPRGIYRGVDLVKNGIVRKIDTKSIKTELEKNSIVLFSPIGYSATGETFLLDSEELATEIGISMSADKLIFITDTLDVSQYPISEINELSRDHLESNAGAIKTKFFVLNKLLKLSERACDKNVGRIHILPYEKDGEILIELFTRQGVGVMVARDQLRNIRPAGPQDINSILDLIKPIESSGTLTKRSRVDIERDIVNYYVLDHDSQIYGCACLNTYSEEKVSEISCLIVHSKYQNTGEGKRLLEFIIDKAKEQHVKNVFVLTTQAEHWFLEHGFVRDPTFTLPVDKMPNVSEGRNSLVLIKKL